MIEDRTIALAGMIQACTQVQQLARQGQYNERVFNASMHSILVLDAIHSFAIYSGKDGVKYGLEQIAEGVLQSASIENVELLRYVMSIMQLQSQLFSKSEALQQFSTEVERLSSVGSDGLVKACSTAYQNHISIMRPQIIVQGDPAYLQQQGIPEKIRCMLLAGVRSSVLWQQKQGSRFKLLWQRSKMRHVAQDLLKAP